MAKQLSQNEHYVMHLVNDPDEDFTFFLKDHLKTLFLHDRVSKKL